MASRLGAAITARHYRQAGVRDLPSDQKSRGCRPRPVDPVRSTTGLRSPARGARHGPRPTDILRIAPRGPNWRERVIAIRQAKTGSLLVLPPLSEDLGSAKNRVWSCTIVFTPPVFIRPPTSTRWARR